MVNTWGTRWTGGLIWILLSQEGCSQQFIVQKLIREQRVSQLYRVVLFWSTLILKLVGAKNKKNKTTTTICFIILTLYFIRLTKKVYQCGSDKQHTAFITQSGILYFVSVVLYTVIFPGEKKTDWERNEADREEY